MSRITFWHRPEMRLLLAERRILDSPARDKKRQLPGSAFRRGKNRRGSGYVFRLQAPNDKGLRSSQALDNLARPAGFEPTTPWFVAKIPIVFPK